MKRKNITKEKEIKESFEIVLKEKEKKIREINK